MTSYLLLHLLRICSDTPTLVGARNIGENSARVGSPEDVDDICTYRSTLYEEASVEAVVPRPLWQKPSPREICY